MTRRMWKSGDQARFFEALVHDNPIRPGEGSFAYAERIALLSGELKQRLMLPADADLKAGEQRRLPVAPRPGERVAGEDDMDGDPNQH